jgi:hypothetical protein
MPYNYRYGYGPSFTNPYPAIILILIVLQWFRVGKSEDKDDLTSNGGLFIIALFLLVYLSSVTQISNAIRAAQVRPRRGLFGRLF